MSYEWKSVSPIDLEHEKGAKRRITAMESIAYPADSNLEFSVLVTFRRMDPLFLKLARDTVRQKLSEACHEALIMFVESYLSTNVAAPTEEVTIDG